MKKIVIFGAVLAVVVTVFLLFSSNSGVVKNYPSSGTNIVAFGDSLVSGVGATEGNDFVSVLSNKIGKPIINLGRSGDTTAMAMTRLDEVLGSNPKIVLLLLGGNDYLRRIPKEETFSNLGVMIEAIQNQGAVVVVLGVRGGVLSDNYEEDFESLSSKYNAAYVPNVLDGLIGHSNLMYDSIHPNDAGYQIISDKIFPVIEGLIK